MTATGPDQGKPDLAEERRTLRARIARLQQEIAVCRVDLEMVEAALVLQNSRERLRLDPEGFLAAHPRGSVSVKVKRSTTTGATRDRVISVLAQDPERVFKADEVYAVLGNLTLKNVRNTMSIMARDGLLEKVAPANYRYVSPRGGDRGAGAAPSGSGGEEVPIVAPAPAGPSWLPGTELGGVEPPSNAGAPFPLPEMRKPSAPLPAAQPSPFGAIPRRAAEVSPAVPFRGQ